MISGRMKNENGAIAIDAALGITFFLLSMCCIMFVSQFARLESQMQYAVDQTAKELSMYYYFADKLGLANLTSGADSNSKDREDLNKTIGAMMDFLGDAEDLTSVDWDFSSLESTVGTVTDAKDTVESLYKSGGKVYEQIIVIGEDPIGKMKFLLGVLANGAMQKVVAPLLCKALLPKYIAENDKAVDTFLSNYGVKGGRDGLNYLYSSLLGDGRTISITVVYTVNTKKLTFGLIDKDLVLGQTAHTAAWVKPGGKLKTIVDALKGNSGEQADDPNKNGH